MNLTSRLIIALLIAVVGAAFIRLTLALITGSDELNSCQPIGAVRGDLTCVEVWTPWEGDTGRGIWSDGKSDGKRRP